MALTVKHQQVFHNECGQLAQMVVGSLLKLSSNPKEENELKKLVQAADTIMGNARFLKDKTLEENATLVVKSFKDVKDVRKKIDEYSAAIDQFGKLVMKNGAVSKGYRFVNGRCMLDNADHKQVESCGLHENNYNIYPHLENQWIRV